MFRIMSITLMNINPQKEIFHHYDFPVYTTSKYRDPKLDTYRRITVPRHVPKVCMVYRKGQFKDHLQQH